MCPESFDAREFYKSSITLIVVEPFWRHLCSILCPNVCIRSIGKLPFTGNLVMVSPVYFGSNSTFYKSFWFWPFIFFIELILFINCQVLHSGILVFNSLYLIWTQNLELGVKRKSIREASPTTGLFCQYRTYPQKGNMKSATMAELEIEIGGVWTMNELLLRWFFRD